MSESYSKLTCTFQRLARLQHAITFLQWDQLVMMPTHGNKSRSQAITELVGLHHEMLTAPELVDHFDQAGNEDLTSLENRSLLEMEREWRRASCVPAELVRAKSLAGLRCEHGWREQRKENDWDGFLKNFKEVVDLSRQEARVRQEADPDRFETPYDALLDLYCTGDNSQLITTVFRELKKELPVLMEEVMDSQSREKAVAIEGKFSLSNQKELCRELMVLLGFDFSRGRLDESMHPFSTGDHGDNRITTRYREDEFVEALQATAHETGHASYENGLPEEWRGLPVGQARNMCLHESQSLLFEKQIFLARPFFGYFSKFIHAAFPQLVDLSGDQIWHGITQVKPNLIRIEADELTYPMHIILRYEIENALINGELGPEEIPDAWNEKMQQYLGISTEGNFRDGCLQDIHWTDGSFGYFPSYTLGAVNGAQIFRIIKERYGDWQERLNRGDVGFILDWLASEIWQKGSVLESQDLLMAATGESTNPTYFLDHIKARYLKRQY
jgi:carboxypeptidase Taq